MTPAARTLADTAPLPGRGERVVLDGLPGGPWTTVVEREARRRPRAGPAAPRRPARAACRSSGRSRWPTARARSPARSTRVLVQRAGAPSEEGRYEARTIGPPRRIQRRGAVRVPVNLIVHARLGDDIDARARSARSPRTSRRAGRCCASGRRSRRARGMRGHRPLRRQRRRPRDRRPTVVRCDRLGSGAAPLADRADVRRPRRRRRRTGLVRYVFERQRELRPREAGLA